IRASRNFRRRRSHESWKLFCRAEAAQQAMSAGNEQRKLAAIMFTDMVGYAALAQRDDKLALELLEEHRQLLREIFPRFNGTEIKTIADAFLIEFDNALEARFEKLGPTELKNISVAMDLFRIVLPWEQGAKTEGRMKNAEKSMSGRSFPASRLAWVGAIVLAGVGAGWWFAHQSSKQVAGSPSVSTSRAEPSTAPVVDQKSIAVLPFVDMSEKKDEEYFADGLSEELIGMLTTVP